MTSSEGLLVVYTMLFTISLRNLSTYLGLRVCVPQNSNHIHTYD